MLVILDIAAALAGAYASLVLAIYTGRIWIGVAAASLVLAAIVYLSF